MLYPPQEREIITAGGCGGKISRSPIPSLTRLASCQPTLPAGSPSARAQETEHAVQKSFASSSRSGFDPRNPLCKRHGDSGNCRRTGRPAQAAAVPAAQLLGISIAEGPTRLVDIDGLRQLIIDGTYSDEKTRDLTGQVQYQSDPPGIVAIDSAGVVTPLADGTTTVTATAAGGQKTQTSLSVVGRGAAPTINFASQVVPVFTKAGCNAGSCHGKLSGQNGFRLSLLGFYPHDDDGFLGEGRSGTTAVP